MTDSVPLHKQMRAELIQNLAPADEVPNCFGTLPQGNESAWAKGCHECPMHVESDLCSQATRLVDAAEEKLATQRAFIASSGEVCAKCGGAGTITSGRFTRRCYACHGTGLLVAVCPKCKQTSGNDWTQCEGDCPMKGSPHYRRYIHKTDDRGPYVYDRETKSPVSVKDVVELLNKPLKPSPSTP